MRTNRIVRTDEGATSAMQRATVSPLFVLLYLAMPFVSGCALVEGIFKAGVWVGVLVVVGILALAGGIVAVMRR